MLRRLRFCALLLLIASSAAAQTLSIPLKPGFDRAECLELLRVAVGQPDSAAVDSTPAPKYLKLAYRSPEVGLKNRWDLWTSPDNRLACVSLRGTVNHPVSWLANFYAGMVPAEGSLHLSDSLPEFRYKLAADPKATVHVGWLVAMASMAPDIVKHLRELHGRGVRQVLLAGHSQGAGLAFLTRSYLHYLQQAGELPADFVFKTYCTAAPKPGNLYYAYDYETLTAGGWGLTVVNPADWVPEVPFSIQTLTDFNPVNPFVGIKPILRKQKLGARLAGKYLYNQMNRSTRKAQRRFTKFLGGLAGKQAQKALPGYRPSAYAPVENFQRAGTPVVLPLNDAYRRRFPDDPRRVFVHHMPFPYHVLVEGMGKPTN